MAEARCWKNDTDEHDGISIVSQANRYDLAKGRGSISTVSGGSERGSKKFRVLGLKTFAQFLLRGGSLEELCGRRVFFALCARAHHTSGRAGDGTHSLRELSRGGTSVASQTPLIIHDASAKIIGGRLRREFLREYGRMFFAVVPDFSAHLRKSVHEISKHFFLIHLILSVVLFSDKPVNQSIYTTTIMLLLRHLSRATRPTAATQFSAQKRRFATGFFEEQVFWKQASIGPFCWLLALSFPLYRAWKDLYWTMNMRSLNKSEIIADRYEWLQQSMLQDEVDAVCALQAGKYP